MCNACGFMCCGSDQLYKCGCEHYDCPDCWPDGDSKESLIHDLERQVDLNNALLEEKYIYLAALQNTPATSYAADGSGTNASLKGQAEPADALERGAALIERAWRG